ncbi:golgin subfamily A member 6-like protein 6, partial [Saccostrea cucullata]|uniref:golgin subfamily A member 6-like protein 6 n=1 Tax=Saccostrea cuccullata TaxID=36930 RepID=UPI002ED1F65C
MAEADKIQVYVPNEHHQSDYWQKTGSLPRKPRSKNIDIKTLKRDLKKLREFTDIEQKSIEDQDKEILERLKSIGKQEAIIAKKEKTIVDKENFIGDEVKIIEAHERKPENQEENIEEQERNIVDQEKRVDDQEKKVDHQEIILNEHEKTIEKKKDNIDKQLFYIKEKRNTVVEVLKCLKEDNDENELAKSPEEQNVIRMKENKNLDEERSLRFEIKDIDKQEKKLKEQQSVIEQQKREIDKQKKYIANIRYFIICHRENIENQRNVIERVKKHRLGWKSYTKVINKVDRIGIPNLMNFAVAMMILAAVLMTWSNLLEKNRTCEREEALTSLNINVSFPCKYQDVREKLESITQIGLASLCFSIVFLCVGFGFRFMSPGGPLVFRLVFVVFIALDAITFSCLLLPRYEALVGFQENQTETDYGKLKRVMFDSLQQTYISDDISNLNTMSDRWNHFFIKYDCCAVNEVTGTTNDFDTTPWCTTSGSCQLTNSQIPKSCCKDTSEDDYQYAETSCHAIVRVGTYKE